MSNNLDNLLISASAGSGKTYRLVTRLLFLLMSEDEPEKMLALTFSRATAGEFLLSILQRLTEVATNEKARTELIKHFDEDFPNTAKPAVTENSCLLAIRRLVAQLNQLNLWTIDSFFNRVLSVFPFEFGLAGGFTLLGEHEQAHLRHQVLVRLFHDGDNASLEAMAGYFIQAHSGKAAGRFFPSFSDFVADNHHVLLEVPDDALWGRPKAIWGGPLTYKSLTDEARSHQVRALLHETPDVGHGTIRNTLDKLPVKLGEWIPGTMFKSPECLRAVWENLSAHIKGGDGHTCSCGARTYPISSRLATALGLLLADVLARDVEVRLKRTRGRLELLSAYENLYRREVRERGRLTFADLPVLLQPGGGAPILRHQPGEDERLWMDYRMDACFDHWFFDEFQDTSNLQWNAIANLAEEAAQGVQDGRSLFVVGDPKQAIYAWRGGDHSLFDKIQQKLPMPPAKMDVSQRSVPAVLQLINEVFGSVGHLNDVRPKIRAEWGQIWEKHVAADRNQSLPGISQLYFTDKLDGRFGDGDYQETIFPLVVDILKETRPWEKGWECAILVSKNKHIPMVVDHLRARDIEVAGDAAVAEALDNPATSLLFSLVKWMAHPRDRFCHEHLRMSPFRDCLDGQDADTLRDEFLSNLTSTGFEGAIKPWAELLGIPKDDAFSKMRVDGFLGLCRAFDETGSRDIGAFLQLVESHRSRPTGAGRAIKVMTIHRSKGATLDMTIVLGMDGNSMDTPRRNNIHVCRDAARNPAWVMELPCEDICRGEPTLHTAYEQARTEATYENLCKLYVALTRAKYGLYVIAPRPSSSKSPKPSLNYPKLFQQALDIDLDEHDPLGNDPDSWRSRCRLVWESLQERDCNVDPNWLRNETLLHKKERPPKEPSSPLQPLGAGSPTNPFPRLSIIEPSKSKPGKDVSTINFDRDSGSRACIFGTEVHAVFEQIEWLEGDPAACLQELRTATPGFFNDLQSDAFDHVLQSLEAPELHKLFMRPQGDAEVWREKHFLTILKDESGTDQFCSGIMDRVVLHMDASGKYTAAEIIDFKTDQDPDPEKYRSQLENYQRVLGQLIGLREDSILTKLLFTRPKKIVEF